MRPLPHTLPAFLNLNVMKKFHKFLINIFISSVVRNALEVHHVAMITAGVLAARIPEIRNFVLHATVHD